MNQKIIFTISIIICILGLAFLFKGIYSFVLPEESKEIIQSLEKTEKLPGFEKEEGGEDWQETMPEKAGPTENETGETLPGIISSTENEAEMEDFAANIEDEIEIKEFKTDKESYGSYEKIKFSLKISSKKNVEGAEIKITGIKPYQHSYINKKKTVSLTAGENIFYIEAETPYCTSGCGGVYPGPYTVYASIFIDGKLIVSSENSINLVSH